MAMNRYGQYSKAPFIEVIRGMKRSLQSHEMQE